MSGKRDIGKVEGGGIPRPPRWFFNYFDLSGGRQPQPQFLPGSFFVSVFRVSLVFSSFLADILLTSLLLIN
jgi:hypothetical protein